MAKKKDPRDELLAKAKAIPSNTNVADVPDNLKLLFMAVNTRRGD